ncbi:Vitamin B12 import ATP-binding protein BtuD [Fusobacterium sp. DD29]|uniref:ABC transporter ATP-binding protein n=1 Tax=unclassified Fusobacterium TaxID=2648384 RepID=UPI001B8B48D2|nr:MULTISPECIES: ABC transporter ATP-binding protein [unclassified Fusobacterium]MBR8700909.1 Vitamin B12 import ATP-binding protein BtuD [Fusobacterium sp. DD45]MBR8710689.1 Vitamin B12 import ATP-binding protein BtuD [Fusobacterium sp. DD28]MBR8749164.1 Vitamin B12 import ATP-binding protein BtuD [Fusobacterium sp. DD29]MBR8751263.1 Vitamin B12 import ATP-binding protein BtuD [Fusobacterium sp. DD26]MBR8761430.1 Vitamin B12 import ATP-binding protein BtuD [Fusobacterium sp. DD25]
MYFRVENIKKRFENEKGISDISFNLEKGELVSFLGPSGCGKTSLLNVIGGFLNSDNGKIYLEDEEITNIPPERRNISTVFQDYALFPHMNVIENIGYGLKYKNKNKKEQKELASKYLEIVGLKGYEKSSIHELSGGQQQRVALARALVLSPKILLLDEPFSNLDAKLKINMREELKALQKKLGITMIFVTHDQEEALSISDKIVIMRDGIIEQIGTPEEIYYKPSNEYVADFIGKVNFIKDNGEKKIVRPEDIKMDFASDGKWKVISKEFMGSHTFFIVRDEKEKVCVSIYGEKSKNFKIGDKVSIEI